MSKKILVIDDEEIIRKVIYRVLTKSGYTVELLGDSREALTVVSERDFDIIIVDLKMPYVSGIDIIKKSKSKNPLTPIIIITGSITHDVEKTAKYLKVTSCLVKPFTIGELKQAVDSVYKQT